MNKKSSSPAPRSPIDVPSLLSRGRALLDQGLNAGAFSLFQMAYGGAPDDPDVLYWLGVAYLALGQAALGLHTLRGAVARRPREMLYRAGLAKVLARVGQVDEAAREQGVACSLRPDDAEALATLASLQARLQRFEDAERSYARALVLQPEQAAWHESLALLQYRRWAIAQAQASVQQARALSDTVGQRMNIGFAEPARFDPLPSPAHALRAAASYGDAELARACDERELLVIDDFLPDPWALRNEALRRCALEAGRHPAANFPGVQTAAWPCDATMQRIADALGRRLKWDSLDHGAVRLSMAGDEARADVHVDNATLPNIFGGVLYLSLPQDCRGGTSFYRHRATGWDGRPDEATMLGRGYRSFLDFQKRHLPANRLLPFAEWRRQRDTTWEWLFEVPMKFNRLIVFRSNYFHAVSELFGDRPENGRLIQLFHFEAER
jgi:Flp pilus assembly protein TadD